MVTIVLLLIVLLQGQDPVTQGYPMKNMAECEKAAHEFNAKALPKDKTNLLQVGAACLRVMPKGKDAELFPGD